MKPIQFLWELEGRLFDIMKRENLSQDLWAFILLLQSSSGVVLMMSMDSTRTSSFRSTHFPVSTVTMNLVMNVTTCLEAGLECDYCQRSLLNLTFSTEQEKDKACAAWQSFSTPLSSKPAPACMTLCDIRGSSVHTTWVICVLTHQARQILSIFSSRHPERQHPGVR